jgi:hypothetical protein
MQWRLNGLNAQIYVFHTEILTVFQQLSDFYKINKIFSHQEKDNPEILDQISIFSSI